MSLNGIDRLRPTAAYVPLRPPAPWPRSDPKPAPYRPPPIGPPIRRIRQVGYVPDAFGAVGLVAAAAVLVVYLLATCGGGAV